MKQRAGGFGAVSRLWSSALLVGACLSACAADEAREAIGARDVREHLPPALAQLAELPRSVFMFTQVTHSRP